MKEILGNNLEQFFFVLDYPKEYGAICTYKSNKYEVWLMDDEIFNMIADISEEEFIKYLGRNHISIFRFDDEEEFLEELDIRRVDSCGRNKRPQWKEDV